MAERSFDAISMAAIAERAEVGRTSIYHHFPDKESVVVAFASHETEQYLTRLLAESERFHMGLGPQLYGFLGPDSRQAIREHVVAVEDVLHGILDAGIETGAFTIEDVPGTMSLIHACLSPRHLPDSTIESFVLRAVGAAG